jgi:predicted secreted protein
MSGVDAFGTQFKRDTTGSGTFAAIGAVADIQGPDKSREALESTTHDSPNKYREFEKGLKDGGEVTLDIRYDPGNSTHADLEADYEEDDRRDYQVVIRPGTAGEKTIEFSALITGLSHAFPHDDLMQLNVTIKISGKPTITATGS